jgi:hypothetical protein
VYYVSFARIARKSLMLDVASDTVDTVVVTPHMVKALPDDSG